MGSLRAYLAITSMCMASCWIDRSGLLPGEGGAGAPPGPPCTSVEDCPGDDDPICGQRACIHGFCGGNFSRSGTECAPGKRCDEVGRCVSCVSSQECAPGVCMEDTQVGGELCLDGECQPLPEPLPCEPYVCESSAHCYTSCTSDTQCSTSAYCDSGQCRPKKVVGNPCADSAECVSGYCTDDVCCDAECQGACETCSGLNGHCTPAPPLQDPFGQCDPPLECSGAGECGICGSTPVPPGGMCPKICDECVGKTCIVHCTSSTCVPNIACPPGWDCDIDCSASNSCKGATIACPEAYQCNVNCPSGSNCEDAVVQCSGAGMCKLTCNGGNTCKNLILNCGGNSCEVECLQSGGQPFTRTGCQNLCNNCSGPSLCPVTG